MMMGIFFEQIDQINVILFGKIQEVFFLFFSFMEWEECLDDMFDWLEDYDIEGVEDIVEIFVDFGMIVEELFGIEKIVGGYFLFFIFWWLESIFSLERFVEEINEVFNWIFSLVCFIKDYLYMDWGFVFEFVDVYEGLKSIFIMFWY